MKLRKFLKLSFWISIYIYGFGFLLPKLFSSNSDLEVLLGVLLLLSFIYHIINLKFWKKIMNIWRIKK